MGPLVPDIITNELNLLVALLVGIAFGFILEQAGFSSSRKLTGLFYGTDFTVLRVFFTAGVTAMTGVLLLAKLGLLDTSIIYVNPTFVHSAIVGGAHHGRRLRGRRLLSGHELLRGGGRPDRRDGLRRPAGSSAPSRSARRFPALRRIYEARSLGDVTVPAYFGVSPRRLRVVMVVVAIAAFVVTGAARAPRERRWRRRRSFPARAHRLAGAGARGRGAWSRPRAGFTGAPAREGRRRRLPARASDRPDDRRRARVPASWTPIRRS